MNYFAEFDEIHAMAEYIILNETEDAAEEEVRNMLIEAYIRGRKKTCDDLDWDWTDYYLLGWDEWEREVIYKEIAGKTFADRVREHFRDMDVEGLTRTIVTEFHRDFETGGHDQAKVIEKESGHKVKKIWNTVGDDRVRETHDYIHGMTALDDSRFYTFDGDSARFPGDFEKPENNIGCRCWLTYRWM